MKFSKSTQPIKVALVELELGNGVLAGRALGHVSPESPILLNLINANNFDLIDTVSVMHPY